MILYGRDTDFHDPIWLSRMHGLLRLVSQDVRKFPAVVLGPGDLLLRRMNAMLAQFNLLFVSIININSEHS